MDRKVIWYNIVPVVAIHVLFLPLWFVRSAYFAYNVSLWETTFNLAVLPIYLIIFNLRHAAQVEGFGSFLPYIPLMWASALLGNALAYLNWGLSVGNLFRPEAGTSDLFTMLVGVNLLTILVLGLIAHVVLQWRYRRPTNPVA